VLPGSPPTQPQSPFCNGGIEVVGADVIALSFKSTFDARVIVAEGILGRPEPLTMVPNSPRRRQSEDFIAVLTGEKESLNT